MISITMIITLLILFVINVPIAFALGITSLIVLLILNDIPLILIPQRMFTGTDSFTLIAIPFFILAGTIMEKGGISEKIIEFAYALVGHIKGGLGHITVVGSMFFAGISGSAVADTAALGRITIPEMIKRGFSKSFATGIQSTAGAIGIIIPPSIIMILFGIVSDASVGQLFLGGVIPGVLIGLALMVAVYIIAKKRDYPTEERSSFRNVVKSFWSSFPALLLPVIILGGIMLGIVTPTESAVVAVLYGLLLGFFYYKKLKLTDLPEVFYDSAKVSAMVMFLVANASVFAWVLTSQRLPQELAEWIGSLSTNPTIVLFLIAAIFLIVGTFLDTSAALIIVTPVLIPIAQVAGIDMVHLGVISVIALAIGLATPPVGLNLFVSAGIANVGLAEASKGLVPFLLAMVIALALLILFPGLVLFLPNLLMN